MYVCYDIFLKVHHSNRYKKELFFSNMNYEIYLCQLFLRFLITAKLFTNKQREISVKILLYTIFKRQ